MIVLVIFLFFMVFMASVGELNCHTVYVQCVCSYVRVVHALYVGLCEQHLDIFLYNAIGISKISLFYY